MTETERKVNTRKERKEKYETIFRKLAWIMLQKLATPADAVDFAWSTYDNTHVGCMKRSSNTYAINVQPLFQIRRRT